MDMDFAKIMQMMNAGGGGGNKDMSMLMQLLPQLMNNSNQNKQSAPAQINLNPDEINKTINKLYNDNE
ncbi:MAG: hypothetical protein K2O95_01070 [Clostridia bacterium]|nr:hypothetical protein [Clostridia bacterium]MDE6758173.1 hypothetical protein [Clostridia bacterium]MDE7078691.1 hypothetical protein [Clostridia bacterium]